MSHAKKTEQKIGAHDSKNLRSELWGVSIINGLQNSCLSNFYMYLLMRRAQKRFFETRMHHFDLMKMDLKFNLLSESSSMMIMNGNQLTFKFEKINKEMKFFDPPLCKWS